MNQSLLSIEKNARLPPSAHPSLQEKQKCFSKQLRALFQFLFNLIPRLPNHHQSLVCIFHHHYQITVANCQFPYTLLIHAMV